jgi:MFS family permease
LNEAKRPEGGAPAGVERSASTSRWLPWLPRVYYGWYVLGVTMIGAFFAAGLSQLFMGVLLKPIAAETGWSRTAISGAITAGTLTGGFIAPLVGRLADRYGPRVLASTGVLLLAGAMVAVANAAYLWQFYLAYVVGRSISQNTLSSVVARTTAVNWFRQMRGRALGMTQMALPLGGSFLAMVAQLLMNRGVEWRDILLIFAALAVVATFLPTVLVLRRRPEDLGLLPDGATEPEASAMMRTPQVADEQAWTLSEAIRTPVLWLLIAAVSIGVSANGAIGFHLVAYYTDKHIAAGIAVLALSVYALSGATANGMWGLLTERFSERYLAAGTMFLASAMTFYLVFVSSAAGAMVFAVLFGLAARGETSLVMIIIASYFGRRHYGTISGFVTPFQMVGLGLGPLLASISYDVSGSYVRAFLTVSVVYSLAGVLLWLAKQPHRHPTAQMAEQD